MHLHIDCDSMVYQIGFSCQDKESGQVEPLPHVLATVKSSLNKILESVPGVTGHSIYLTGRDNFRNEIYPEYKANRTAAKPLLYHVIRTYLEEVHNAIVVDGMEADDAVAIALTNDKDAVCVSMDKDLLTVPGWHLHPKKLEEGLLYVTEYEAYKRFYTQLLCGDATDNIRGVGMLPQTVRERFSLPKRKGVGERSAEIIFAEAKGRAELESLAISCYGDRWLSDGIRNARLLHMTRELRDGKPVLWEPLPV